MKHKKHLAGIPLGLVLIIVLGFITIKYLSNNSQQNNASLIAINNSGLIANYSEEYKTGYYLYIPKESMNGKEIKYPLVIHLHGWNGSGNGKGDLGLVMRHGLYALTKKAEEHNMFVLAPQSYSDYPKHLENIIDDLLQNYPIDKNRTYLTGVSMGGNGTWAYARTHADQLAAIVPICSDYILDDSLLSIYKDLPIWVFHGARDTTASISTDNSNVEKLRKINSNVKYTVFEDRGHEIWDDVYNTPELYEWLLKQGIGCE